MSPLRAAGCAEAESPRCSLSPVSSEASGSPLPFSFGSPRLCWSAGARSIIPSLVTFGSTKNTPGHHNLSSCPQLLWALGWPLSPYVPGSPGCALKGRLWWPQRPPPRESQASMSFSDLSRSPHRLETPAGPRCREQDVGIRR